LATAANEVSGETRRWKQTGVYLWVATGFLIALIVVGGAYYIKKTIVSHGPEVTLDSTKTVSTPLTQDKNEIISRTGSRNSAYLTMFNAWQITYNPKDSRTACEQALSQGVRCHEGKGTIDTLRQINKPALLRLIDPQGKDYYLVLTSLNGDNVTYTMNGETKSGNVNEIIKGWQGDYEVLLRFP
jgi:hypothetical protein